MASELQSDRVHAAVVGQECPTYEYHPTGVLALVQTEVFVPPQKSGRYPIVKLSTGVERDSVLNLFGGLFPVVVTRPGCGRNGSERPFRFDDRAGRT